MGSRVPTIVQSVLLALAWGASFLFIKIGLEGLSPGQVVLARMVCGAVTLGIIGAATRTPLPGRRSAGGTWHRHHPRAPRRLRLREAGR